jgi:uncharacterized protein (DUF302 family)
LLFGNPKAGTVLMNASSSVALDLPLKILAWEDTDGQVWVSYNSSEYLRNRHRLGGEMVSLIAGFEGLLKEALS